MRPGQRFDPAHWDGAASLLHAGFTVWGKRQVQYSCGCDGVRPDAAWDPPVLQAPGDFYVGNVCAAWHRVVHGEPAEAEPLFHDGSGSGVLITVMLRTDVFRANRARLMRHKARIIVDDGADVAAVVIVVVVIAAAAVDAADVAASGPPEATPTHVYGAVNNVVAEWLVAGGVPIRLPSFEECLAAYHEAKAPAGGGMRG